ncbi:hypothetical protein [Bradyrhizobium lablabi]|uniref:hypothetical protein n=1 Tax=Bradyrhizobium lablabi TaxID=722472 RepID=UPI001BAD449A|nr:hypothetical protein [Bradyrhizobium lablabi]MBR0695289.1 hypothetical protein [Bradyrhizobium lablabi]
MNPTFGGQSWRRQRRLAGGNFGIAALAQWHQPPAGGMLPLLFLRPANADQAQNGTDLAEESTSKRKMKRVMMRGKVIALQAPSWCRDRMR